MAEITVDFVAFDDERNACRLVLIEEAWESAVEDHLRHLQERLFGCLDASLDGQVAELFPKSLGRMIVLQIDCYGLPRKPIDEFVRRFSIGINDLPDYSVESSPYISGFQFEVHHGGIRVG